VLARRQIRRPPASDGAERVTPLLVADCIRKHYRVRDKTSGTRLLKAVDGVSFTIHAGRTLGIVGESGCGKSTTARLTLGLIAPSAGRITLDGEAVGAARDAAWRSMRRRMQMVYQDPFAALDRRMPVGEQIMEPLAIQKIGDRRSRAERAMTLFEAVGLRADLFRRYPHELSGGQRQRAVLARALILEPSLVVCDEPVSSLDVSVAAQVMNLLQDMQQRFGMAYLFISHDLKMVRQIADEVAVMYLGRIVEQGAPETLFHAPAHPYTEALVSAVPSPRRRIAERIILSGDPPNPVDIPSGCPFHPRCARAVSRCKSEAPQLRAGSDGRLVACHLAPGSSLPSLAA
jgi:peptide/nickel transport system ATP-binding protein